MQSHLSGKDIAALADGTYHVVGVERSLLVAPCDVDNLMNGLIESGAYQLGHAGIDDSNVVAYCLLDIEAAGNESATLCTEGSSQLEVQLLAGTQVEIVLERAEICLEIG